MSDLARVWDTTDDPVRLLELHPLDGGRKARLLLVACCRLCGEQLAEGSRRAVEVGERWADGRATAAECRKARQEADAAARLQDRYDRRAWPLAAAQAAHSTVFDRPGPDDFRRAVGLLKPAFAAALVRDVLGRPHRPAAFAPEWRTDTAVAMARAMYESRDFSGMSILADALQDAGCDDDDILAHCRDASQAHVRGCWVTDLVLGKS